MAPTDSSRPEPDPAAPVSDSASGTDEDGPGPLSALPAEHRDAIRRLSRRVAQAVETIEHLRAENERLRRRVEELETGPDLPDDEVHLSLDDDPAALRERITQFIDAIDACLERPAPAPSDAEDAPPDA
ncbi:MAG: cell division protein ZapB [Salinibacter sp.]